MTEDNNMWPNQSGPQQGDQPGQPNGGQPGQPGQQQPGQQGYPNQQGQPPQGPPPQSGQIRYQDPNSTTAREPTLAEQRARLAAESRREQQEADRLAAEAKKTDTRRKVMIGGGATVGVVALVAAFYTAAEYSQEANAQTATCTVPDPNNPGQTLVQKDEMCDQNYIRQHQVSHGGMFMMPIFLPGGAFGGYAPTNQYRYSYSPAGSSVGTPGKTMTTPPNFTKPDSGTKVSTKSGTTVQRGGFGIGGKGSSGS